MTRPGFTIIETALVLAIVSILSTLALMAAGNSLGRTWLTSGETVVIQTVRRAQILAQQNVNKTPWGVYFCPGSPATPPECGTATGAVILFPRNTFTTLNSANDTLFTTNERLRFSGSLVNKMSTNQRGLVFTQLTGDPTIASMSGIIILTLDGESRWIRVNGKGVVER